MAAMARADVINSRGEAAGLSENTTLDPTCPPYDPPKGKVRSCSKSRCFGVTATSMNCQRLAAIRMAMHLRSMTMGKSRAEVAPAHPSTSTTSFTSNSPTRCFGTTAGRSIWEILAEASGNFAFGINNRGDVVGASDLSGDNAFNGFLWTREKRQMQDLAAVRNG